MDEQPPDEQHWSRPDLNRGLGLPTFEHSFERSYAVERVHALVAGAAGVLLVAALVVVGTRVAE